MPTFNVEKEEITAFNLGDTYIFKTYFDKDPVYNQLQKYYNENKYRLELPDIDLDTVEQLLDEYYYELEVTDNFGDYCVVAEKGTDSSDILRNSVMRKQRAQHEIFVMKDELSVKQTVEQGAERMEKSGIQKEEVEWKPHRP
jgi:hypothetical protein